MLRKSVIIFLLIIFAAPAQAKISQPKNIIFLIGDGMGLSQITYGMLHNSDSSNFLRFKNIGLIKTHSATEDITDSAAAPQPFQRATKVIMVQLLLI